MDGRAGGGGQAEARRQFTTEYGLGILEETDRCSKPGGIGRFLRREGLYSSHMAAAWRKERHGYKRGRSCGLEWVDVVVW